MFKRAIIKLIKLVTRQKVNFFSATKRVTCILKVPEVAASSIDWRTARRADWICRLVASISLERRLDLAQLVGILII